MKIGFTAPLTGALAGFGEANPFILDSINKLTADGIMLGDKSYKVEIIQKDVESSSDTAASQAGSLILDDGVDLMLAIATPEMINPVADQCEANGVPCLSTLAPWQPYFLGRGGDPAKGFDWTYHFFWGADQLVGVFADMWQTVETNKIVGLLCPNDPDGNALASPDTGFPAGAKANGYTMIDPGRFEDGTTDFSGIIGQFKQQNVEIITGIPIPPDFANFWTQANQQGLKPKLVTMAKAVLFSSAVEALGDIGNGLASEVWWTPNHPFSSSLTGETSKQLGDEYTASTGKQWTQFLGFVHALFEVCFDVLSRAGSTDKQAIADAAGATKLDTMVGPIQYGVNGLPKNISPTSLVGGQWQKTDWWPVPVRAARHQQLAVARDPHQWHVEAASLTSPCRYDGTAAGRRRQQALRRACGWSIISRSMLPRARPSASSGPTARARPPCSTSSPVICVPTAAPSSSPARTSRSSRHTPGAIAASVERRRSLARSRG